MVSGVKAEALAAAARLVEQLETVAAIAIPVLTGDAAVVAIIRRAQSIDTALGRAVKLNSTVRLVSDVSEAQATELDRVRRRAVIRMTGRDDVQSDEVAVQALASTLRDWETALAALGDARGMYRYRHTLGQPYVGFLARLLAIAAESDAEMLDHVSSILQAVEGDPRGLWAFARTLSTFARSFEHAGQPRVALLAEFLAEDALLAGALNGYGLVLARLLDPEATSAQ